jgi:type II secretory pathway component PulF
MKYDEFAFFNQQLAAMLREGMPLEGALKRLSADMSPGPLRTEIQALEEDLAKGTPLDTALAARKLPEFYVQMVKTGAAGNDLPGMLTMLADHYQQSGLAWTRLKGLMVYPVLVLIAGFALSLFLSMVFLHVMGAGFAGVAFPDGAGSSTPPALVVEFMAPPTVLGLVLVAALAALAVPRIRRALSWRLSAFKDANLARLARTLWLVLKGGGNLGDALTLVREMEKDNQAGRELARWQIRLAGGASKFSDLARPGRAFPPLFVWLVASSGEDLAAGFKKAAEIYAARAANRTQAMLYTALPFAILAIGGMALCQTFLMAGLMAQVLRMIGDAG